MTWGIRLKLLVGILLTFALVIGLTLMLNRRISQATSVDAEIGTGTYDIGSEYAGTVTQLLVSEGEEIQVGQPVATILSGQLEQDFSSGEVSASAFPGGATPDGVVTLVATEPGTVATVNARQDSFLRAGAVLATIDVAGTRNVEARLEMEPRDYARLAQGAAATITLPDLTELAGEVDAVSVTSEGGLSIATVRIRSEELADAEETTLTEPGTPVTVSVALRNDGPVSETLTTLDLFLQRIGL